MQHSTITATDMFCGAGGSTTDATLAGADVRLAINHWKRAIETHNTNYPGTTHVLTDLHQANPRRFPSTTLLLASPECTSHSISKGKKRIGQAQPELPTFSMPNAQAEEEERSRCTMWTPLDWCEAHSYRAVILENVVDVHLWRPFPSWLQAWKSLEYDYELVYLNSMFAHPTPQSRDRMYFVAWKRGQRKPDLSFTPLAYCATCEREVQAVQCWKHSGKRYGKYRQQYVYLCSTCINEVTPYYYPAASAIDWTLPIQRIGDRAKPLKEKTMKRIAYGLEKFAGHPFAIPMTRGQDRLRDVTQDPFPTQTATETQALVMSLSHGTQEGYVSPAASYPLLTQTTRDDVALVTPPFLLDHLGEYRPRPITGPCSTICAAGNHHSLVLPPGHSWLMTYYHHGNLFPIEAPTPTVTTLDRCALVTDQGRKPSPRDVDECGFRMLVSEEIQAAMAFPRDYILTGSRRERVKQLGNAVTPPAMKLLVERVIASLS